MRRKLMAVMAFLAGVVVLDIAMVTSPASASMFNFVDCTTITAATPGPIPVCPPTTTPFEQNSLNSGLVYKSTDDLITGLSVTAWTGLPASTSATDIEIKNDITASGEVGLGIANNPPEFEITTADLMNLDTSSVVGPGTAVSASITIQSIQGGEGFTECLGDTPGQLGSVDCHTFTNPPGDVIQTFSLNVADLKIHPVVGITASAGDVLLQADIHTFSAPEPASVALSGAGFLGIALLPFLRRRSIGRHRS
jgi:hypothetical protein